MQALQDKTLVYNMTYMLDMGFSNFEVNLNLLKRNNNDLVTAINSLENGIVTESMFMLV